MIFSCDAGLIADCPEGSSRNIECLNRAGGKDGADFDAVDNAIGTLHAARLLERGRRENEAAGKLQPAQSERCTAKGSAVCKSIHK